MAAWLNAVDNVIDNGLKTPAGDYGGTRPNLENGNKTAIGQILKETKVSARR
jgi:hypothetical protein